MMVSSTMMSTYLARFCIALYELFQQWAPNIFIMQQKLIITLWKAQFKEMNREKSMYCRLTYNNNERNSKVSTLEKNFVWKETFIFPLAKKQHPLQIDFIPLKDGQTIHFAKDQVAESLSFCRATMSIDVDAPNRGSLPVKLDILDKEGEPIGKIFIEHEQMKTEVSYTVQKQLDYLYLLKMTGFKVTFVRRIKNNPKFYLHFYIDGRVQKQILPFQEQQPGVFMYNYPVKLYLKKEIEAEIVLFVKEEQPSKYIKDNQTQSEFSDSVFSQKKTLKSSIGKKDKLFLDLSKQKVAAIFDLTFKRDVKVNRKLPLTTIIKFQKRDIGNIQFQAQTFFRSKEELQVLEQQKKGLNPEKDNKSQERKKNVVKQSNGIITINSILGKLQLFNDAIISGKNMSMELKLGLTTKESSILEKPGKQIIFIDTFTFKRTWQETIKVAIIVHHSPTQKLPTYFADVNLRQLFDMGRLTSKKVKLIDQHRNYSGQLILDLQYRQMEEKRSPSLKEQFEPISEYPQEFRQEIRAEKKKMEIVERMKVRQQAKVKAKQLNSMSTLAVLESNDILLPPLKNMSRMSTLSPRKEKTKGARVFNVNGSIKIPQSSRFQKNQYSGYQSYTYVRQSDFDGKKKRGASIGIGNKHDFTRDYEKAPGVGRYEIQSVWDKYKIV